MRDNGALTDVPQVLHVLLNEDFAVPKGCEGFRHGTIQRRPQLFAGTNNSNTTTAATV